MSYTIKPLRPIVLVGHCVKISRLRDFLGPSLGAKVMLHASENNLQLKVTKRTSYFTLPCSWPLRYSLLSSFFR